MMRQVPPVRTVAGIFFTSVSKTRAARQTVSSTATPIIADLSEKMTLGT